MRRWTQGSRQSLLDNLPNNALGIARGGADSLDPVVHPRCSPNVIGRTGNGGSIGGHDGPEYAGQHSDPDADPAAAAERARREMGTSQLSSSGYLAQHMSR
jgi:hypothetical protein